MWDFTSRAERALQLRRIIRRETIRLVILTAIAVVAFVGTRALASRAEQLAVEDAAAWYDRGRELLETGNPADAAVAFRRATMKERGEKRYALALAEALARSNNLEAAGRALLALRELSPEDIDVNLALARLSRRRGEIADAVRYYQHAIYAPGSSAVISRDTRFELVEFLLQTDQPARALSELIAASLDLPDDPGVRLALADLLLRAGSPSRAAEQYGRVLASDKQNPRALEGAVRSAFALGDYRRAAGYRLPDEASAEARGLVTVAREVLARDPLASRLSAAERRRRLLRNLDHLQARFTACAPDPGAGDVSTPLAEVATAARRTTIGRDTEALESAMSTLEAVRQQIASRCGPATPVDQALAIISRLHGLGAS